MAASGAQTTWTGSLHQTFRLLPIEARSSNLLPFLSADGLTASEVLKELPYDTARAAARGATGTTPDARRYRDGKQVYQTVGLLYEDDSGVVRITQLGIATLRWLDRINDKNAVLLARHAAYALAACQLRNPTGAGARYDDSMVVFPFQFIWRAMIELDGKLNSDELNRAIFRVKDETSLAESINKIREARDSEDVSSLGDEVITGKRKNDRIIPWMSLASFGWTLFSDKRDSSTSHYELSDRTYDIIREASRIRHKHREFKSVQHYCMHVSRCAALPKDIR